MIANLNNWTEKIPPQRCSDERSERRRLLPKRLSWLVSFLLNKVLEKKVLYLTDSPVIMKKIVFLQQEGSKMKVNETLKKATLTTLSGAIIISNIPLHVFAEVMDGDVENKVLNQEVDEIEQLESESFVEMQEEKDIKNSIVEAEENIEFSDTEMLEETPEVNEEPVLINEGNSQQETDGSKVFSIDKTQVIVDIPDANLQAGIRSALNKPTGDITQADMETLTRLEVARKDIADLTGLQYAKNLRRLDLGYNQITDISCLSSLKKLETLLIGYNNIVDISALSELISLSVLNLDNNQIEDISGLKNLTNLTSLSLSANRLSSLEGVRNLTSLTFLQAQANNISDISPIVNLTNLETLRLHANRIKDVSPLSSLTNLSQLWLYNNQIVDIEPLAKLINLTELELQNNKIENIHSLAELSSLNTLVLNNNNIRDFSPLSNLSNITILNVSNQNFILEAPVGYTRVLNPFKDRNGEHIPLVLTKGSMSEDNRYIVFDSIEAGDVIRAEITQEPYQGKVTVKVLEDVELPLITIQQNKVGLGDKELIIEVGDGYYDIEKILLPDGTEVEGNQAIYLATTSGEHTIKAYDLVGNEFVETVNVVIERPIVAINHAPVIEVNDVVLTVGDTFNPLDNVLAIDNEDGEVSVTVIFDNVDVTTAGVYTVTYQATDSQGASSQKAIAVTVLPKLEALNHAPVIEASNVVIYQGQPLDLMTLATAFDKEDGELPVKLIASDLDTTQVGIYKVTYEAIDSKLARVVKTISIAVRENLGEGYYTKDIKVPMTAVFDIETILQEIAEAEGLTDIKIIETNLNPSVEGEYDVTFEGKDKDEYKVIQTIKVTIEAETVDDSQKEEVQVETGLTSGITTSLGGSLGLIGVIILGRKKK